MRPSHAAVLLLLASCRGGTPASDEAAVLRVQDTLLHPSSTAAGRPVDLAVAEDGTIYVTDAADAQVLVLDPAGAVLRRIGRRGRGPGELLQPRNLFVSADTLWVSDAGGDRLHVFTRAGVHVRTMGGFWGFAVADLALTSSGDGLLAQHGRQGVLARRIPAAGGLGSALGTADPP